jgi:hypothetical protein
MTFNGKHDPFVACLTLFSFVVFQLSSGKLLTFNFRVWLTRKDRARAYWSVLSAEIIFVLTAFFVRNAMVQSVRGDTRKRLRRLRRSGEPGRTRTYNPLLKRQLLYH